MTSEMNKRTRAAFHKALYRHASREIDNFDVVFVPNLLEYNVPIIISV